jgi:DNA-3-methyladenine glycosylase
MTRLPQSFFARPTLTVARELLGTRLVHVEDGQRISGFITETEAYIGEEDDACHARAGRTPRTEIMYGPAGFAYVYFNYGMHWLFNVITEEEGFPAAVLVRALEPVEGIEIIKARRARQPRARWTDGPAKLCQAFGINGSHNKINLCDEGNLFIEEGAPIPDSGVTSTPRVGLNKVSEPWKSIEWRFIIHGS